MRPVTFNLDPDHWEALHALALERGVSRSALLRKMVAAQLRYLGRSRATGVERRIQRATAELVIDGE